MNGIYNMCYKLLVDNIFGGSLEGIAFGEFFCQGISIVACAFLIAVPFIIVWRVIRRFL